MSNQFGLSHFFSQADGMALGLLALLVLMSLCTWTLAGQYFLLNFRDSKHYQALLTRLKNNNSAFVANDFKPATIFTWAYQEYTSASSVFNNLDFLLDRCASRLDRGQILGYLSCFTCRCCVRTGEH
jgi:hypothetical protein